MSRLKERKEKICLNCKAELSGRYCHICGQENLEPKESVWDLISHFFKDITHFDGKFFSSLKYLIIRPGYLSTEYMIGRRASYINPIRMYIFTSAFFFLIFFAFINVDKKTIINGVKFNNITNAQLDAMDSLEFDAFTKKINRDDGKKEVAMTRDEFKQYLDSSIEKGEKIRFTKSEYKTKAEYDSVLSSGKKKHNWFEKQLIYKAIEINEKYKDNSEVLSAFARILIHSLPQMFFILLPLFALILKLLYIRRKNYYYVNHGIFSIHFYIFSFIAMLFMFGLSKLNEGLDWVFIKIVEIILGVGIFFYLYKSMRNFYRQRRAKTITKFLILCLLLFITFLFLFVLFIFLSLFKL